MCRSWFEYLNITFSTSKRTIFIGFRLLARRQMCIARVPAGLHQREAGYLIESSFWIWRSGPDWIEFKYYNAKAVFAIMISKFVIVNQFVLLTRGDKFRGLNFHFITSLGQKFFHTANEWHLITRIFPVRFGWILGSWNCVISCQLSWRLWRRRQCRWSLINSLIRCGSEPTTDDKSNLERIHHPTLGC